MLRLILFVFFLAYITPCEAQYFDTLHIHYDIGIAGLQQKDKAVLDSLAQRLDGRKILIYSYADYLGSERPNQHLSDNRADEVKDYLLKKGVTPELIGECTGLGKVAGSGGSEGDVTFRRTDIFIRRKESTQQIQREIPGKQTSLEKINSSIPITEEPGESTPSVTFIDLDKVKVNETINLQHIFFYIGRSDIMPSSLPELDNLYNVMHDHPKLKIKLEGHVCCCVYPDGYFVDTPTWGLSIDRASKIYQYLISRGISAERMQYEGFGRTRPIRDNERTIEEGQVNRRVEIRILQK